MYNIKKLNNISPVIYDYLPKDNYNVSSHLEECEAMIVRSADCKEIEFPKDLLAIARAGAGTNNIPIEKCTDEGIVVFNTPGANANGVKELVIGAMISASRNLPEAYDWAKTLKGQGEQVPKLIEKGKSQFVGGELKGKTLGVIGLGAIGIMVANTASAIGMNVIGYDPFLSVDKAWTISMYTHKAEKLDELLEKSDFISLHIPQTDKTKGFLSSPEFAKMKKGVIIMNFARGGLVKTTSLLDAISEGIVSKYVTDFPDDELLCHNQILAIPHLGASTPESEENCAVMAAQQLRNFFETGSIVNSVNMPECIVPYSDTARMTIIHKNTPNMVGQITNKIALYNLNIADMANKSRGEIAYTVLNLDHPILQEVIDDISSIDGVVKVRVVK
ncbi:MAG: phosphoglycerate dehydrogenase [Christensenellaceae bacterium]